MYKFKEGDKITAPISGHEFQVILPFEDDNRDGGPNVGYFVRILKGALYGSHTILWCETGLELVKPEPKFKVGDVVWFTGIGGKPVIGTIEFLFHDARAYTVRAEPDNFPYDRLESGLTKHNGPVIKVGDYVYSERYGHGRVTKLSQAIDRVYAHINGTNVRAEDCQVMKAPPKFKVGDKVTWCGVKSKPTTIDKVKPSLSDPGGWCYNEDGIPEWALKTYVEHKFKVGDQVKTKLGSMYNVVNVNDDGTLDVSYYGFPGQVYPKQNHTLFTLVETPKPEPEPKPEFKVGDAVRLKSGSVAMSIRNLYQDVQEAQTNWFDGFDIRTGVFKIDQLIKVY